MSRDTRSWKTQGSSFSKKLRRERGPTDTLISDFYRTMREHISVSLIHPVCGNLLQQPQKTNTGGLREIIDRKQVTNSFSTDGEGHKKVKSTEEWEEKKAFQSWAQEVSEERCSADILGCMVVSRWVQLSALIMMCECWEEEALENERGRAPGSPCCLPPSTAPARPTLSWCPWWSWSSVLGNQRLLDPEVMPTGPGSFWTLKEWCGHGKQGAARGVDQRCECFDFVIWALCNPPDPCVTLPMKKVRFHLISRK